MKVDGLDDVMINGTIYSVKKEISAVDHDITRGVYR